MKRFYIYAIFILFAIFPKLLEAQTTGDFRSRLTGTWAIATNWETFNGTAWVTAAAVPNTASGIITIRTGNTITTSATATADQIVVQTGATLTLTTGTIAFTNIQVNTGGLLSTSGGTVTLSQLTVNGTLTLGAATIINQTTIAVGGLFNWNTGILTVNNPTAGADLIVNGILIDNSVSSASFSAGGTWELGANGTYVKQRSGSVVVWRDNYNGGMFTIPATSNWIIRKNSATNPIFTSVGGSYYGNFTIENLTATTWTMVTTATFTGNVDFPRIKGNFDIGGTGSTAAIDFLTDNVNVNPVLVMGNMIVRAGNNYRNFGTGTEVQGNLTMNGTTTYDASDTRRWIFSGANAQTISGGGAFNVFQMIINKTANNVTLSRAVTIDNNLVLTFGKIISTAANLLTIADPATVTVTSPTTDNSFVSGPIRKINTSAGFSFPVGKGNNYQPALVNTHAGGSAVNIYSENFNSGAPGWTLNVVTGIEGADPNFWLIDDNEGGVLPPGCGVANNGNPTLHVTSVFNPTGGAAYDAGGLCGFFFCPRADRRCESPVINCSGQTGIFVGFNYIEGGSTTIDNATLWYFDGATWVQLDDMPKTATGCGGQGIWTNRQIALPASANNNPNVRIAFRWQNNDDGAGSDPSFAVDDVVLLIPAPLDIFTCEYFQANAVGTYGTAKEATIDQIVTNEYWVLDRNAGAANKQVTLSWDQSSTVTDAAASKLVRWDGAMWRDHFNGGTSGINANDPGCTTQATCGTLTTSLIVSSFSPFTFATPIVLPITLQSFEARKVSTKSQLNWVTASEENVAYFEVERSQDGLHFDYLGRVQAVGNSHRNNAYQYIDVQPFVGNNYYRFKSVDNDASFSYSPVRVLNFEKATVPISIMPNPVNDILRIQLAQEATSLRLELFALDGRLICTDFIQVQNAHELDMKAMAAGFYLLRLTIDGDTQTLKVEKK